MTNKHRSLGSDGKSRTSEYGTLKSEDYMVPITPLSPDEIGLGVRSICSTVASSESDTLLERYDILSVTSDPGRREKTPSDAFFEFLGFESNPIVSHDPDGTRNSSAADLRLSMLSNVSTAYNVISISLSLHLMQHRHPATPADQAVCSSALIAGMIVGQLLGGALGDILGRHLAMTVVVLLQVFAALATALSHEVSLAFLGVDLSIFHVLAFWRLVLGVGCGGVYPLAAILTAESSQARRDRGKAVALTFSLQGVGYLAVPVISWAVLAILGEQSGYAWRLILGFGAVPGLVLTVIRVRSSLEFRQRMRKLPQEVSQFASQESKPTARVVPVSILDAIVMEESLMRKMMGTG